MPKELRRREARLAAIEAAKERLEAAQRGADDARGREPGQARNPKGGRPYKRGYGEPKPKAQSNFTDPESGRRPAQKDSSSVTTRRWWWMANTRSSSKRMWERRPRTRVDDPVAGPGKNDPQGGAGGGARANRTLPRFPRRFLLRDGPIEGYALATWCVRTSTAGPQRAERRAVGDGERNADHRCMFMARRTALPFT